MSQKVAVLIPAAGSSSRFSGKTKKQFEDLSGRAVFIRTIEQFADRDDVVQVLLAIPPEDEEIFQIRWADKLGFYGVRYILGGTERYETVDKLLEQVKEDVDLIAMHDAVRPCVTQKQIDAVFETAGKTGAAILAHKLSGTIKQVGDDNIIGQTVDRSDLWEAQTPQVFKSELIRQAHQQRDNVADDITDDAQLVEALGHPVSVVQSDSSNIKITTRSDLVIAAGILKARPKPKKTGGPVGPWAAEQGW